MTDSFQGLTATTRRGAQDSHAVSAVNRLYVQPLAQGANLKFTKPVFLCKDFSSGKEFKSISKAISILC